MLEHKKILKLIPRLDPFLDKESDEYVIDADTSHPNSFIGFLFLSIVFLITAILFPFFIDWNLSAEKEILMAYGKDFITPMSILFSFIFLILALPILHKVYCLKNIFFIITNYRVLILRLNFFGTQSVTSVQLDQIESVDIHEYNITQKEPPSSFSFSIVSHQNRTVYVNHLYRSKKHYKFLQKAINSSSRKFTPNEVKRMKEYYGDKE